MVGPMSEEPATVLDAVRLLDAEGFGASFALTPEGLKCGGCGTREAVDKVEVLRVYRFEGPSDPDEEAVVYGLRCPVCNQLGTLVSSFGPTADPELTDRLVMLDARFEGD
jgi:hypothetical protein